MSKYGLSSVKTGMQHAHVPGIVMARSTTAVVLLGYGLLMVHESWTWTW
jgi:hypothetical protein